MFASMITDRTLTVCKLLCVTKVVCSSSGQAEVILAEKIAVFQDSKTEFIVCSYCVHFP